MKPRLATQSGPMLVIDGKLHPRFEENGASRYIRNGVGTQWRQACRLRDLAPAGQPRQLRAAVSRRARHQERAVLRRGDLGASRRQEVPGRRRTPGGADSRGDEKAGRGGSVGAALGLRACAHRLAGGWSGAWPASTMRSRRRSRSAAVSVVVRLRRLARLLCRTPCCSMSCRTSLTTPLTKSPIADIAQSGTLVCSASACSTPPMLPFSAS